MRPAAEPIAAPTPQATEAAPLATASSALRRTPRADVPAVMRQLFEYLEQRRDAGLQRCAAETVPLGQLVGRCLAESLVAPVNLPAFRRAMMDGLATNSLALANATHQLQVLNPATTTGTATPATVSPATEPAHASTAAPAPAVAVSTGGRVPDWADVVVPVEWLRGPSGEDLTAGDLSNPVDRLQVSANQAVRPQQHIADIGEDVRMGQVLLDHSRPLRPQDVALLAACDINQALCRRQPRVALAITGDEIIPVGTPARGDQVFDANGPVLQSWVQRDGARLVRLDHLPDHPHEIRTFLQQEDVDVIVLCGGTSVGRHDHAAQALAAAGQVAFRSLPLRPGRPAVVGQTHAATVFLLPGNPIACQFTYDLLVGPLLRSLAGRSLRWPYRRQLACLAAPVSSQVGRLDYLRVTRCAPTSQSPTSTPPLPATTRLPGTQLPTAINDFPQANDWGTELSLWDSSPAADTIPWVWPLTSGRASNLTSVSRADGFVLVPWHRAELNTGESLEVFWFDA